MQNPVMHASCASAPEQFSIQTLSELPREAFSSALEGLFEHSPWVVERTWGKRPFRDAEHLLQALVGTMHAASSEEKLSLIRAHPELAGKAAIAGTLTAESKTEQASARLDACTPEEFARWQSWNADYSVRFGFPFILAVRGLDRAGILDAFARRIRNSPEAEYAEALTQIAKIAALRLQERLSD
jgi:2-oxo-4-hydroxy-4-carboxy-5-ureidoimidazoline decarboxylase